MCRGYSTSHGSPAITSTASAPPTPTAHAPRPPAFGVCESVPMMSAPGKRVVLEHDLVDDAGARAPEARAVLRGGGLQEVIDLLVLGERLAQVALALDARLDQVVAVDRGRHRDRGPPRLHELQHGGLAQHVLQHDAIGTQEEIAAGRAPSPGARDRRGAPATPCPRASGPGRAAVGRRRDCPPPSPFCWGRPSGGVLFCPRSLSPLFPPWGGFWGGFSFFPPGGEAPGGLGGGGAAGGYAISASMTQQTTLDLDVLWPSTVFRLPRTRSARAGTVPR